MNMPRTRTRINLTLTALFAMLLATTSADAAGAETGDELDHCSRSGIAPVLINEDNAAPNYTVGIHRFWSPVLQGHFYTGNEAERDAIIERWPDVWTYEGQRYRAFAKQTPGTVPLYRFWSARMGGHFYTADEAEKDAVIKRWPDTWCFEGVAYYVYPSDTNMADTVSVSRFWGPGVQHHFYTASAAERDAVRSRWSNVWTYEGVAFRVPASGVPVEPPPTRG